MVMTVDTGVQSPCVFLVSIQPVQLTLSQLNWPAETQTKSNPNEIMNAIEIADLHLEEFREAIASLPREMLINVKAALQEKRESCQLQLDAADLEGQKDLAWEKSVKAVVRFCAIKTGMVEALLSGMKGRSRDNAFLMYVREGKKSGWLCTDEHPSEVITSMLEGTESRDEQAEVLYSVQIQPSQVDRLPKWVFSWE